MADRRWAVIIEDNGIKMFAYYNSRKETVEAVTPPSKRCIMTEYEARKLASEIQVTKTFKLFGIKKLQNTV